MFHTDSNMKSSQPSSETTYILQQNKELHAECASLRKELQTQRQTLDEELRELKQERDELETDSDKTDQSLRYLRNLQQTLATLHVDCKHISDGYKACHTDAIKAVKHFRRVCDRMRATCAMVSTAYAMTMATSLVCDMSTTMMVCVTTTAGIAGVCTYVLDVDHTVPELNPKLLEGKSKALKTKEVEYTAVVNGLPGISELIDNI
jgi:hypothetical protein